MSAYRARIRKLDYGRNAELTRLRDLSRDLCRADLSSLKSRLILPIFSGLQLVDLSCLEPGVTSQALSFES